MGSKVDRQPEGEITRQPEGEVARQAKFFQPPQPIPNPIRDRSGQPGITQDVISVQTCSSEDSKSLNVEQTHDRTGRPVTDTAAVQDDSQVYHEPNMLNVDEEVLRERMEKSIVVHDENHEPMMVNEADMDFKIPGLPHSIVKHAQKCQRSRIDSEN